MPNNLLSIVIDLALTLIGAVLLLLLARENRSLEKRMDDKVMNDTTLMFYHDTIPSHTFILK